MDRGEKLRLGELVQSIGQVRKLVSSLPGDLRNAGLAEIPELVIVGSQTRGKSSLVEAIAGLPFNYTSEDIASRFPIRFNMVYSETDDTPNWKLEDGVLQTFTNLSTEQIAKVIRTMNEELQKTNSIRPDIVDVTLSWKHCDSISFIDLPGLRAFAQGPAEGKLRKDIADLVKSVLEARCTRSNVTLVVVELAHEDKAVFHALGEIERMVTSVKKGPAEYMLVLNKFDCYKDPDARKIRSVYADFQTTGHPVFFLSVLSPPVRQAVALGNLTMETELEKCSDADTEKMRGLGATELLAFTGFHRFKRALMSDAQKKMLDAIPKISRALRVAANKLSDETNMLSDETVQRYVQKELPTYVVNFAELYVQILGGQVGAEKSGATLEEELKDSKLSGTFSYRSSPVWLNLKYQVSLRRLLLADLPFFGGGQLRRVLREFELCILVSRFPAVENERLMRLIANLREAFQRKGTAKASWPAILEHIVGLYCQQLLVPDIKVFRQRLTLLLLSWIEPALDYSTRSRPPAFVRELLIKKVNSLVVREMETLEMRLTNYVTSAIRDFKLVAMQRRHSVTKERFVSSSPSAQQLFEAALEMMRPTVSLDPELKIEEHEDFQDEATLEKVKYICALQLLEGARKVGDTFETIFSVFFKDPFCEKLAELLSEWATSLPSQCSQEKNLRQTEYKEMQAKLSELERWSSQLAAL